MGDGMEYDVREWDTARHVYFGRVREKVRVLTDMMMVWKLRGMVLLETCTLMECGCRMVRLARNDRPWHLIV